MVIGSLGAAATEAQQKYYNNGPFIYLLPHRTADVRDGLSTTMFVGETIDGHNPETLNCWPLSVAYLSCLRSTENPLNTPDPLNTPSGGGIQESITNSGLTIANLQSSAVRGSFASHHVSGANFAFGDAHVQYISQLIDMQTYQDLSNIARGRPIDEGKVNNPTN
jgi:hypothetical protein